MDIEGLGEAMVEQLVTHEVGQRHPDIYGLQAPALAALERMGEKSAANLIEGIAASKERPLWKLLFGLGILHLGASGARTLSASSRRWMRSSPPPGQNPAGAGHG